ncbi:MAG TPA: GNAT family N-acetyltransferase [Dehalococcoidales bacterium]
MVWDQNKISFRKLGKTDLPMIHKWLNFTEVAKWVKWDDKDYPSLEFVERHWIPRIRGSDPTKCYIVIYDKTQIAFIQSVLIEDNPRYKEAFGLGGDTVAIDIFIGEGEYIHKGLGSLIIRAFLRNIVFKVYDVDACIIDPEPTNKIAIRAYEKTGFRYSHQAWNTEDKAEAYIMTINRESV